jgi:anti-sigma B factor antagonist
MQLNTRQKGNITIVAMSGQMTAGEGELKLRDKMKELLESGVKLYVLDLTQVPWLDSLSLGELIACNKRVRERGGVIKVVLSPKTREILSIARVYTAFDVFEDVEAALASFAA